MNRVIKRFGQDESGASMVEYALLVAVIALVAVGGAVTVGTDIDNLFGNVKNCVDSPSADTCKK